MQGITEIIKETNQKSKINNQTTTQKVLNAFLAVVQQKLLKGESINFKGYFTLKRSTTQPKGSKHCGRHEKAINDYKQANKGKGLAAFTKSSKFRSLVNETSKCKECQSKKQQLRKSVKPLNRINLKPSKMFWKVSKPAGKRK